MKKISYLLCYLCSALTLAACTAQEKKVVKELEDMPGITCVIGNDGQSQCGPDSLKATQTPTP